MSSRVAVRDPRPRAPLRDADYTPRGTPRRHDSMTGNTFQDQDTFDPQDDLMLRRATRHERLRAARERQMRERQLLERARRERAQSTASRQQMPQPLTAERTLRVVPGGKAPANTPTTNDQVAATVDDDMPDATETGCTSKCPPCHRGLYALTLLLAVLSIPLVYSASTAIALDHYGYTDYFLTRQIGFVLGGLLLLTAVSRVPARHIRGLVWVLFAVTVVGLLATKFTPLGLSMGGVRRWVKLGPIPLQFSELAKIALIGVLADFWSRASRTAQKATWPWLVAFGLTLPVGILVFVQPHLSAAALLFLLPFCIAFFAAVPGKQMVGVALVLLMMAGVGTLFMKPYQRERLVAQFSSHKKDDRGSNYQALQGMRALERGGLLGTGPGGGLFKQGHLPAPHTDFILAVTGEEWGLVGMLTLLGIYGAIIFFCFHTAHCAGQTFDALICAGVGTLLAIQLLCNASVVTGVLPVTGMPLPLISYGGSGLLCTLLGIGLVLSISRQTETEEDTDTAEDAHLVDVPDYADRPVVNPRLRQQPYLL